MQFNAPAFQVERSDGLGGISHRIKQGGHQDDGAAAAALAIYVKTDRRRVSVSGRAANSCGLQAAVRWPGFFLLIRMSLAQAFAATEVSVSGLMQSHEALDAAAQQPSHGKEGAECAVARNDVSLHRDGPRALPKELTFMHAQGGAGKMAEERPASLRRQAGTIDNFDLAGKPAALARGVLISMRCIEMAMDVQKHLIGKPLTGLTVGAGIRDISKGARSIHQPCTRSMLPAPFLWASSVLGIIEPEAARH